MSFFPSPDPMKLRAMRNNYAWLQAARPDSHPAHGPADAYRSGGEWPYAETCVTTASPAAWPSEHHGLPIQRDYQSSGTTIFPSTTPTAIASHSMPEQWSMPYVQNFPGHASIDMVRKDSALDFCDPLSTFLPVTTTWDPAQTTGMTSMPTYETSPGRSEYSTSSQPSVLTSSPYTVSEVAFPTRGSPYIKVEGGSDGCLPRIHSVPGITAFGQSMLVNPVDVYSSPPLSTNDQQEFEAVRPVTKIESEGVSSFAFSPRPHYARSRSLQGATIELLEDRRRRSFTTHANSTCACDKCGKLFQRTHNLKAHMETHDPNRDQPHVCSHINCRRRFVRRTDLSRHEQSVHLKARNHACPLCNGAFARKDTLRRHIDDGCPRRPAFRRRQERTRENSTVGLVEQDSYTDLTSVSNASSIPP